MKYRIVLWLLVGVSLYTQAQTITIKDEQAGTPLELATLMCDAPIAFATTNVNGQADISAFKGARKIEIRMLGYKTETKSYSELTQMKYDVTLTPSSNEFDEIVVSATRWSQTSRNIPSKISIISAKDVAFYNPQTAADLLGASGEVYVQKSQQGGGSPMIRGFSTNRLLYTVDGVRMNSAIFRAGNLQNVISLDPLAIESSEVFFGPSSVIYGSDAIGGVMSFQTLTPQLSLTSKPLISAKAVTRFSSANNELTNHIDVKVGWKKWASVTSLTHSRYGDLKMGKNGPDEYLKNFYVQQIDNVDRMVENPDPLVQVSSGYSQMNLMQKLRFSPNKNWDFDYAFHYSETSEYSRYDRLIETSKGLPVSAVWKYGPQIWMMNNVSVTHNVGNAVYDRMTIRLAQQNFQESRIDRKFYLSSSTKANRLRTQLEEVDAYSANVDFVKSTGKHEFYYGLEYVYNDVSSTGSAVDIRNGNAIAVADRYPASTWESYAAYLNYQYQISNQLLIQAGARFSAYHIESDFTRNLSFYPYSFNNASIKNSATTGNLGLVYRPDETWKISANASTGFRAPNVDDIGKMFDFGAKEVVVPNPSLKAEYAYNGELSISKIVNKVLKVDVTGFYTYLDQAMVRRDYKVNGMDSMMYNGQMSKVYAIQNAAYGTVYGFNAGVEIKLPSGFSLNSRYNYQIGTEEMDNGTTSRSRHAAPAFGVTRLNFQQDKLHMQIYALYSAEVSNANLNEEEKVKPVLYAKDADGNPYSPAWYTLNFKAMYQFLPNLAVTAGVENITDQRYRSYSSGLVAPGRNFVFSLRAGL